jgi:hypothetical protein
MRHVGEQMKDIRPELLLKIRTCAHNNRGICEAGEPAGRIDPGQCAICNVWEAKK